MSDPITHPAEYDLAYQRGREAGTIAAGRFVSHAGFTYQLLPDGHKSVCLGYLGEHPPRRSGTVTLLNLDSLIEYLQRNREENCSAVYFDPNHSDGPRFIAVINGHAYGDPDETDHNGCDAHWGDHRVVCSIPYSDQWKDWTTLAAAGVSQDVLAEFIEDHIPDIGAPDAGQFLDAVRTLQVETGVRFTSAVRTNQGLQISYTEVVDHPAGTKDQLTIPEEFTLVIPIYTDGDTMTVTAKLRWVCRDGKLSFRVKLVQRGDLIRQANHLMQEAVQTETHLPVYLGSPAPALDRSKL